MDIKFKKADGSILYTDLGESSIEDLENKAIDGFPNTKRRQHTTDTVKAAKIEVTPFTQSGEVLIKADMKNNDGGKTYKCAIMFDDVKFHDEDSPTNITFTGSDSEEYHMSPLKARGNEVKVQCNCMDFYYRFATWNFNNGSLYGKKPPPYRRKTDTRPSVNPEQVEGLCKHLMKLAQALHRSNILED